MEKNRMNMCIGIILGILFSIASNFLMYLLLIFYEKLSGNNIITISSNIQIPEVVIPSLIAIVTIFFTIIALSFNLSKKLPDEIIDEYILYDKILWTYLSYLTSLIIFLVLIASSQWFNLYWPYVFIFDLGLSLIVTFWFFNWFLRRTNKKTIYRILENKIEKVILENQNDFVKNLSFSKVKIEDFGYKYRFSFDNFDIKKINQINAKEWACQLPELLITTDKEGMHHYTYFSSKPGIIDVKQNKIEKFIREHESSDDIKEIKFVKENNFVMRLQPVYEITFYLEDSDIAKNLIKQLSDVFKLKDLDELKELNEWLLCMTHSRENSPKQLEEDFHFLQNILKKAITKNPGLFQLIFNSLENNFDYTLENNEKVMEQTLILIYRLKEYYIKNLPLVNFMQSVFKNILLNYSSTITSDYSSKYATSILYLSELISFDFVKQFEYEQDTQKLDSYEIIIRNTIENSYQIMTNTIRSFFKNPTNHEIYLKEHMQQFINLLQFYHSDPYQYNNTYYNLEDIDKAIIDKKCKIVKKSEEYKRIKIAELAFHLFYLIENKKLPLSLKDLVFDFMNHGDIYADIDPAPFWTVNEKLHDKGVFTIPEFPREKYSLLFLFNLKQSKKEYVLPKWTIENIHLIEKLKNAVESFDYGFVNSWIKIEKDEFEQIKKELIIKFDEGIKSCKNDEEEKIVKAILNNELITSFRNSVEKYWKDNAVLRKLFEINNNYELKLNEKSADNPEQYFGFYLLFEKSYFIRDSPVYWVRTLDSDYGTSLARSENEKILKEITSKKDLSLLAEGLEPSLNNLLDKFQNKNDLVILVDSKKWKEFQSLESFTPHYRLSKQLTSPQTHHSFIGLYKFENIDFPVYSFNNINVLVIVDIKKIGKLVQYSPFENKEQELYIDVAELDEDDIKKLSKTEEGKSKVKIRIAEKFRLEDIDENAFEGYKLKD